MQVDLAWLAANFPALRNFAPLSAGGQKIVLSVEHPSAGKLVFKLIKPAAESDRIRREIESVGKLPGVRVPRIHEVGTINSNVGDLVWLLEEFVPGSTLRADLSQGKRVTGRALHTLAGDVLAILFAAEQAQIVHRDVKPDNLMIDAHGRAWLLDFGIARVLDDESLTDTHARFGVGTPGYAPPEQFRNRKHDIDGRADLFGWGVTLYEAATGTNPFRDGARDGMEMIRRVERLALPRLPASSGISSELSDLVYCATRPQLDHRPATVAEAWAWMCEIP